MNVIQNNSIGVCVSLDKMNVEETCPWHGFGTR